MSSSTHLTVAMDVTTLYGFLAYVCGDVGKATWAYDNYMDLTVLMLLGADPVIHFPQRASRPALDLLPLKPYFQKPDSTAEEAAATAFKREYLGAESNIALLRDFIKDTIGDPKFAIWLKWHRKREWKEHIERFNGLIRDEDEQHLEYVTRLADLRVDQIRRINDFAYANRRAVPSDADMERAYVADIVVRGVGYEHIAVSRSLKYWPHQVRRRSALGGHREILSADYTLFLLAEAIRRSATIVYGRRDRVAYWLDAVVQTREALAPKIAHGIPETFYNVREARNEALELLGDLQLGRLPYFRDARQVLGTVFASIGFFTTALSVPELAYRLEWEILGVSAPWILDALFYLARRRKDDSRTFLRNTPIQDTPPAMEVFSYGEA